MNISIVNDHTQTERLMTTDISVVFDAIKTGGKQKELITQIRKLVTDGAEKNVIKVEKAKLPAIMFGGTFSERRKEKLINSSGLMVLDFDLDKGDAPDVSVLSPFIYAMFRSPSGNGWKVLIRIPEVADDAEYKNYFYAIQKKVPQVDPSGKDISRLCYFSYDEEILVMDFDKVKVWEEKIESFQKEEVRFGSKRHTLHTNWQHINTARDMIINSMVGSRHGTMLRAGRLIGGYIAGKELDESEAKQIIHSVIQQHSPDDYQDHIRAFNDAVEHGKREPLTKKELKDISEEVEKLGTIHIEMDECEDEMDYRFENGLPKGYKLGWSELDQYYTMLLGSTTYVYSSAYSGKSQFLNEALVNLSKFYGMRHAIFSPETGNAAEVYIELAQIYLRKDWKKGVITDLEKEEAKQFLRTHFVVIDGDFFDKELSIKDVCDYVSMLEYKYNKRIHTLTIDPWNELKHKYSSRQDLELEDELRFVRKNAKNNERHIFIVTHVRDQDGQYDREGGFTYYTLPTFRDVSGGQTWSKKGMMMIAVWRPVVVKKGNESNEFIVAGKTIKINQSIIQVQKAKPKGYGGTGEVNLYYQASNHSYKDDQGNWATHPDHYFTPIQNDLIDTNPF